MGVQTIVVVNFRWLTGIVVARATSFERAKLYGRADNCSCEFQMADWHRGSSRYEFCIVKLYVREFVFSLIDSVMANM